MKVGGGGKGGKRGGRGGGKGESLLTETLITNKQLDTSLNVPFQILSSLTNRHLLRKDT